MAFGKILASLRKSRGMSQEQLAEQLNLTRQTISKWELDQSTPDMEYIIKFSDLFGVTTDYLIKGGVYAQQAVTEQPQVQQSKPPQGYTWCFFGGLTFTSMSLLGIVALAICSAFHDWTVVYNNYVFEGFIGFLMGSNTLWLFIVLAVTALIGIGLGAFGVIRNITYKAK